MYFFKLIIQIFISYILRSEWLQTKIQRDEW